MSSLRLLICLLLAINVLVGERGASQIFKEGEIAEQEGRYAQAYLLYSQAAALEPRNMEYWAKSQSVRTRALLAAPPGHRKLEDPADQEPDAPEDIRDPSVEGVISEAELSEARRPQPPVELHAEPGQRNFDLRGDSKQLFEKVARAFGLDVVFDGEYQSTPSLRFSMDQANFRTALRALESATGSFAFPISNKVFMVAKDTPQKRVDVEPTMALVVPLPEPVTIQEAQELARTVQQVMEIQKFTVDSSRRMALMRDRVSKVRPAQELFRQLLHSRSQLMIEMEFLDVSASSSTIYGLRLPTSIPIVNFGGFGGFQWQRFLPAGFLQYAVFGGGASFLGLGLADARLFATMTRSTAKSLLRAEIRSVDGQPATLHVGDRYPILTAGYFGRTEGEGEQFLPPPSFNFEDLGLVMKITPRIHNDNEVSLEVEAEFKVLTGQAINGIPVISSRKFQSKIRIPHGKWAVVAGLMNATEVRSIAGIPGLTSVPVLGRLLSQNNRDKSRGDTLLVLKPKLISAPTATEAAAPAFWVGSESRPLNPL